MNTQIIEQLIADAGFSNTFEQDRLINLCKLTAMHCVGTIISTNDIIKSVATIVSNFDINSEEI
jgi:hypothetical protein